MNFKEQQAVVEQSGLNVADTKDWALKFRRHKNGALTRGIRSELTFGQYIEKVCQAGLTEPKQIGCAQGQFVLGRVGDDGNYVDEHCRFITSEQNRQEALINGGVAKAAAKLAGRTKENHEGRAAQADKLSRDFLLIDPNGVQHQGRNVKEFCQQHGLDVFCVYRVLSGSQSHHQRWTGRYIQNN